MPGDAWEEIGLEVRSLATVAGDPGKQQEQSLVLIHLGLLLSIAGSVATSAGLIAQKHSWTIEKKWPLYSRWRWWCGFFLLVVVGE